MSDTGDDAPRLLSLREAAASLGVSRATLFRIISRGELTTVEIAGRTLIRADHLGAFIASHTRLRDHD